MVALEWGLAAPPYEYGVDRGIIELDGVVKPWNGLVSVDASETGQSVLKSYLDGVSYVNLSFGGFYEAVVEAYDFIHGFEKILGEKNVVVGFRLTGQGRSKFNFSYRSNLGEDGYKIHIVYNAIATQVERSSSSMSEDATPDVRRWKIDATPPNATTHRPTAHFVVDSTKVDADILEALETLLYGDAENNPDFPTPAELLALF